MEKLDLTKVLVLAVYVAILFLIGIIASRRVKTDPQGGTETHQSPCKIHQDSAKVVKKSTNCFKKSRKMKKRPCRKSV